MKYIIVILLLLIYCSCHKQLSPKTVRLCNKLEEIARTPNLIRSDFYKIDSLLKLSADYPKWERITILCKALPLFSHFIHYPKLKSKISFYLPELEKDIPQHLQKETNLALLDFYSNTYRYDWENSEEIKQHIEKIANILFQLEYKEKLTDKEKYRLLAAKSYIYVYIFKEYTAALQFCEQAQKQAQANGSPQDAFDILKIKKLIFSITQNTTGIIETTQEQLNIIEKNNTNKEDLSYIYTTLCHYNLKQQNYREALYWSKRIPSSVFKQETSWRRINIYIGLDSLYPALHQLNKKRQVYNKTNHLGQISYTEALIWKKLGQKSRYETSLIESIRQYDNYLQEKEADSIPLLNYEECNVFAPSREYAQLLWQQGKHHEAIARLEKIIPYLLKYQYYEKWLPAIQENKIQRIEILTQLANYNKQMQQQTKALQLLLKHDSLMNVVKMTEYKVKQRQSTFQNYAKELNLRLDLLITNKKQQSVIIQFILFALGIAISLSIIFYLLYCHRQKELNLLYARQKEIEELEHTIFSQKNKELQNLTTEEQLFKQLEKHLFEKKLFLNPDFSREDLCRLANSNRMYVSSSVNKYAGMNINQWINKARINFAIQLIQTGETNLQTICEKSGFSSTTSFFRNFKQFTLLSPKQYIDREIKKNKNRNL